MWCQETKPFGVDISLCLSLVNSKNSGILDPGALAGSRAKIYLLRLCGLSVLRGITDEDARGMVLACAGLRPCVSMQGPGIWDGTVVLRGAV